MWFKTIQRFKGYNETDWSYLCKDKKIKNKKTKSKTKQHDSIKYRLNRLNRLKTGAGLMMTLSDCVRLLIYLLDY